MDVRLVGLLASFIGTGTQYTLARLEYAIAHPDAPAPPVIDRLPDASESTLRGAWPAVERQLEAASAYAKHLGAARGTKGKDYTARRLRGTLRELDQYARAIRWFLTVTQR